jgi:ribosomal protein S18 acetylase RimI-like enzyme
MIAELSQLKARVNESRVIAAITAAFAEDPVVRWMYPDGWGYWEYFPDFARAFAGKAFANDTADELEGHGCAAMWLPPGIEPDEAAVVGVLQRTLRRGILSEVFEMLGQMAQFHPTGTHWYLPMIGVDPREQGQGLGSALLRRGLARCDRDQLPAYLESTNPRNVPLYERFGFKVVGEIKTTTSPVITPMIRLASCE